MALMRLAQVVPLGRINLETSPEANSAGIQQGQLGLGCLRGLQEAE